MSSACRMLFCNRCLNKATPLQSQREGNCCATKGLKHSAQPTCNKKKNVWLYTLATPAFKIVRGCSLEGRKKNTFKERKRKIKFIFWDLEEMLWQTKMLHDMDTCNCKDSDLMTQDAPSSLKLMFCSYLVLFHGQTNPNPRHYKTSPTCSSKYTARC